MRDFFARKRPYASGEPQPRNVRRKLAFEGTVNATIGGFISLWKIGSGSSSIETDLMFADDAYIRKEYLDLYELIRGEFAKEEGRKVALVRGSSGTGKSAFLQYIISRIRDEVSDVLVVQGESHDHSKQRYLHLSTNWWGRKIATELDSRVKAHQVEKYCAYTLVDGCDWTPIDNFTVGAASPSTPWKGFRRANLLQLCMPLWTLDQLEECLRQKLKGASEVDIVDKLEILNENYALVGGIARWVLGPNQNVVEQVSCAVLGTNFETLQSVMTTQHAAKNDEKELVHRLVSWSMPLDEDGKQKYVVTEHDPIHYRILSHYASKKLAAKAATLTSEKRKRLISELKGESAASAYRGVIFEADAIDRLVCGGEFKLRKCTADPSSVQEEVTLTLTDTSKRYAMADLSSLNVSDALNRIIVPDARNFESSDAFCVLSRKTTTDSAGDDSEEGNSEDKDSGDDNSDDNETIHHYETLQFQMTVGESHATKLKGVKDVLKKTKEGLRKNSDVTFKFVYVVPNDVQECYMKPQSVLKADGGVRLTRDPVFSDRNQYRLVIDY